MDLPECGRVHEISSALSLDKQSVRITGRLTQHDCINRRAFLSDPSTRVSVCVDTTLTEPLGGVVGSQFQVIGRLEQEDRSPVIRTRIMRCVDGLDLLMYDRVLKAQQQHLRSRGTHLI
ncbi:CST complex subunit TEN1-like [Crassostrea virginica]